MKKGWQSKKNNTMENDNTTHEAFGYHLLLDCYECDASILNSINACYDYLDQLVDLLGVSRQSQPYVFRTPDGFVGKEGLSGWVPLVESGISIHTLTGTGFVSIDLYCCKKFDKSIMIEFTKKFFKTNKVETQYLLRGKQYGKYVKKSCD